MSLICALVWKELIPFTQLNSCQYEETVESCKPRPTEPVPTTTTTEPEPETTTTTQPTTQKPEPTTTTPETITTEPEPEPTTPHPETTTSEAEPEPTEPEPEPTTEAPKPSDKYCPEGWKLNGDSCYFFSRSKAGSFDKALDYCQALGGYLVEIDSEEEDQFVVAEVSDWFSSCKLFNCLFSLMSPILVLFFLPSHGIKPAEALMKLALGRITSTIQTLMRTRVRCLLRVNTNVFNPNFE